MNEIKKYYTASAASLIGLDKIVGKLITEGWQPFGNPYVLGRDICQAMVSGANGGSEADATASLNAMMQGMPSQIMRPKG